jgi:hypothetical protein
MKLFQASKKKKQQDHQSVVDTENNQEAANQQMLLKRKRKRTEAYDNAGADILLQKVVQSTAAVTTPVLPRACLVARELLTINDEAERWGLIANVWVEMLYYVAPRCGCAFHYEHLSTGGEFITVASGFKDKIRYTPYVSPGSQITHMATNKGNIKRQMLNYIT